VFEGGLLGAIERMQLGQDGTLLDAFFLRRDPSSGALDAVDAMGATLEAGAAIFAILCTGGIPTVLEEAVRRCGGRVLADEPIDARSLAQAGPRLRAAVGSAAPGT
jgi:hypothetical protein